jgi:transcriptional regulator with XRE-family HTH domain
MPVASILSKCVLLDVYTTYRQTLSGCRQEPQNLRSAWDKGCEIFARIAGSLRRTSPKPAIFTAHVSRLERGRTNVTVNTARQIAHVLQITLSELFRGLG